MQTHARYAAPTIVAVFDAANTCDMETGTLGARKGHIARTSAPSAARWSATTAPCASKR